MKKPLLIALVAIPAVLPAMLLIPVLGAVSAADAANQCSVPAVAGQPPTGPRLDFTNKVLAGAALQPTDQNLIFMGTWMIAESGADHGLATLSPATYNPLNTTVKMPGSTDFNKNNGYPVQNYLTLADGVAATVHALTNGLYETNIMAAMRRGTSALDDAYGLAASPWGTGAFVIQLLTGANPTPPPSAPPPGCTGGPLPPAGPAAAAAVAFAISQLGKPYVFGAAGPDAYDCSGLTMQAYALSHIVLPHDAAAQYSMGNHPTADQVLPGDLVFFSVNTAHPEQAHHVGIVVAQGVMIDAPFTGSFVRYDNFLGWPDLAGYTRIAG